MNGFGFQKTSCMLLVLSAPVGFQSLFVTVCSSGSSVAEGFSLEVHDVPAHTKTPKTEIGECFNLPYKLSLSVM